jgi:Insect cuticle protein
MFLFFTSSYQTGDGITVEEKGRLVPLQNEDGETVMVFVKKGSYSYTSPDGTPVSLSYTADEHGFRVSGSHLPVAPKALF